MPGVGNLDGPPGVGSVHYGGGGPGPRNGRQPGSGPCDVIGNPEKVSIFPVESGTGRVVQTSSLMPYAAFNSSMRSATLEQIWMNSG